MYRQTLNVLALEGLLGRLGRYMGRVLYYDCFAGISGDMNLAALVDLGVPLDYLQEKLALLPIGGEFDLIASAEAKNGICGTRLEVRLHDAHPAHHHHEHHHHHSCHSHSNRHRHFSDVREMIERSSLDQPVKDLSLRIFSLLAEAEAEVHGKPVDEVHFHEVGAVDSIVDIVGSSIAVNYLRIDKLISSTIELGSGVVRCAHGVMPVPAPATALLAKKFPSRLGGTDHEATTPTGAAFIAAAASGYDQPVGGRCVGTGIGIGHRDSDKLPNILRVLLYETEEEALPDDGVRDSVCRVVEANLDDMTPEHISCLAEHLFKAGAMDVWQEAIMMKKGRMGCKICALASAEHAPGLRRILFTHSTTFGLRELQVTKYELPRQSVVKSGRCGDVKVKQGFMDGRLLKEKPEFEDCRDLSEKHRMTIREITDTIQREY